MPNISPALIRPVIIVASIVGTALMLALLTLVITAKQALVVIEPARLHIDHLTNLHETALETEKLLFRQLSGDQPSLQAISEIEARLSQLIRQGGHLQPGSPARLTKAREALEAFSKNPQAALVASLVLIREVLADEAAAQSKLVREMHDYAIREYRIAIAMCLGLPVLAALTFLFFRGRILHSLNRLTVLLNQLGRHDFAPAPVQGVDKDLVPVLTSYNHLVKRLAAAEAENVQRRGELEAQVHAATRTLLRQGRELADADRLAALGETSARIAHELRNPLAGIELGLRNLRHEAEAATGQDLESLPERLDPMIGELQRMSRLLTTLLEQGRRCPEPSAKLDIASCMREMVTLARYQTPDSVTIATSIAEIAPCFLPRDTLKQIIFNLLLNSVQAIGVKKGQVKLSAIAEDGRVVIRIADDGPGFPADILDLGPRPFMTKRPGGTGLGLSTVRRLAEQMGGTLVIANRPEGGAEVTLNLPNRTQDV